MNDCALCGSLSSERTACEIAYEDDLVFCKVNKFPVNEWHVMVLPRRHVETLEDVTAEELSAMFALINKLTNALMLSVEGKSPLLAMHFGKNKSQKHVHFHITSTDHGFRYYYSLAHGKKEYEEASAEELENMHDRVRALLEEK